MMNSIKKILGLVWIGLAVIAYYFLFRTAADKISAKPTTDTIIEWSIFALVFFPIAIGLVIFGWFAFRGAYDHLPESSSEVEDD
jgi:hypothetical protein